MAGRAPWAVVCALLIGACSPAVDEPAGDEPAEAGARNLLLITVDTLRADRLGLYGYGRPTSPRLDAFGRQAVVFDAAHSSSSWTLPGVASLMTGLYTSSHGCWSGRSSLAAPIPTLAERLAAEGFDTGAVVSHVFLDRKYGLDRGFADYDDELVQETKAESHLAITSPRITDKALAWLEQRAGEGAPGRPWFLWVHYFDPHQEYRPHEGISEAFGLEQPSDLYDGEVAFTDRHVGRLLDGLDALGPAGETVVVVTSDHGEEFGDHGGSGHRVTLYEEVLRVPLMIRAPGAVPGRRAEVVSLVDLAPSALELLGLPPIEPSAGRSLVPLLTGRPRAPRPVLGELGLNVVMVESIVEANWKLVVDREEERVMLFDLARDPAEADDLAEAQPERVDELRALLAREVARGLRWGNEYGPAGELELSERDRARLRELGYVED